MGIYGAGKAFNLRYAQRAAVPTHCNVRQPMRGPQMPMPFCGGVEQTTTVEVNNGPGGFWGFALGALNALGCGGFGGGGSSVAKTDNNAQSTPANNNQLKNLKTLGPEWKIVDNGDGTFTAARDGYESKTGNYEEVRDHIIAGNKTTTEPEGTPAADDNSGKTPTAEDDSGKTPDAGTGGYESPGKANGWGAADAGDLKDGIAMMVHDDAQGGGTDINGDTKIVTPGDASTSNYPKKITIKGYNYEFTEVKNGVALYKSLDGKGNIYRLEKNSDGSLALNQYDGDTGAGSIDISSKKTSTKPAAGGNNKETQVQIGDVILTKDKNGIVTKAKIPYVMKDAGEVPMDASEIEGKTDEEIAQLAKEKIKEQNNPKPATPNYSWNPSNPRPSIS